MSHLDYVKDDTFQETKKLSENITTITQSAGNEGKKYKSSQSLHELGLDNYPNPEWPEGPRLNRYTSYQVFGRTLKVPFIKCIIF